ncbi:hypothetical protein WA158_004597 [Blastocystis sp. Blastoise]
MSAEQPKEIPNYTKEVTLNKIKEMVEFMEFSVKQDTACRGTFIWNLITKDNENIPFCVTISEEDGKVKAKGYVDQNTNGDVIIDVSSDDFFAVYNGDIGAAQLASYILSGRIYVRRFKYKQVSVFANSFEFTSEKWVEFYAMKKKQEGGETESESDHIEEINADIKPLENDEKVKELAEKYRTMMGGNIITGMSTVASLFTYLTNESADKIKMDTCMNIYKTTSQSLLSNNENATLLELSSPIPSPLPPLSPLSTYSYSSSLPNESNYYNDVIIKDTNERGTHETQLDSPVSTVSHGSLLRDSISLPKTLLDDHTSGFHSTSLLSKYGKSLIPASVIHPLDTNVVTSTIFDGLYTNIQQEKDRQKQAELTRLQQESHKKEEEEELSAYISPKQYDEDYYDRRQSSIDIDIDIDKVDEEGKNGLFEKYSYDFQPIKNIRKHNTNYFPSLFQALFQSICTLDGEGYTNNPLMAPYVNPYMKKGTIKDKHIQNIKNNLINNMLMSQNIFNNPASYAFTDFSPDTICASKEIQQTVDAIQDQVKKQLDVTQKKYDPAKPPYDL